MGRPIGPRRPTFGGEGFSAFWREMTSGMEQDIHSEAGNRVLVVGASGFLGRALCDVPGQDLARIPAVRSAASSYPGTVEHLVDITDPEQVDRIVEAVGPAWVVNAAAETGVDRCEEEPDRAYQVHVEGTQNLVRACERTGSGLVFMSTNYVFDGTRGLYGETDTPNPLGVYGRTKLEGEACVLEASCPGIVVRTAVLYGYREGCRPNFVTWAAGALARGEPIRVVTDEWANPTLVDELASFVLALCRRGFDGVVHFAGADFLSRYAMVEQICDCFGLDIELATPVTSSELGQRAQRPPRAGLATDLARTVTDAPIASFRENLRGLSRVIDGPTGPLA